MDFVDIYEHVPLFLQGFGEQGLSVPQYTPCKKVLLESWFLKSYISKVVRGLSTVNSRDQRYGVQNYNSNKGCTFLKCLADKYCCIFKST